MEYEVSFLIVDSIALFFAVLITIYSLRTLTVIKRMKLKTTLMLPILYSGILLLISYAPAILYGLTDNENWMLIHHALVILPFIILMLGIRSYQTILTETEAEKRTPHSHQ